MSEREHAMQNIKNETIESQWTDDILYGHIEIQLPFIDVSKRQQQQKEQQQQRKQQHFFHSMQCVS